MKYISADDSGLPFDLQRNFGDALIRLGLVKEFVPPPIPHPTLDTRWTAARFLSGQPRLDGSCPHCHNTYHFFGRDISQLEPFFIHCATREYVPLGIVREYAEMLAKWVPPKPKERVRENVYVPEM